MKNLPPVNSSVMRKILILLAVFIAFVLTASYLSGYGYIWGGMAETYFRGWKNSNIDDLSNRTPRKIETGAAWVWPEKMQDSAEVSAALINHKVDNEHIASFLVIHRDTIRCERYWQGHDAHTLTNSFSMAKTITALAVGMAIDSGYLELQAPVHQYLPRFAEGPGRELTVEHLLQMRSHIPFGEDYKNPFAFMAKAYYAPDIASLLEPYAVGSTPGTEWEYQGGNTMLLEELVRVTSGKSLSDWVEQGLWKPMGATDPAYWGLDAPVEEGGIERSFAQYYATTRDYARFGALLLDTGKWQGTPLVPQEYTARLLTPIHRLAPACDATHYGYQIWLGNTEDGLAFSAMEGHRGQFVISVPALDLVVVRTGYDKAPDKLRHLPGDVYRCIVAAREVIGS